MKTEDLKDTSLFPPGGTYRLCENLLKTSFSNLSEENVMVFKDQPILLRIYKREAFETFRYRLFGIFPEAQDHQSGKRMPVH